MREDARIKSDIGKNENVQSIVIRVLIVVR